MRAARGQSLVLGGVLLAIAAVAVAATLKAGFAVHDRIRLQNAADAAAYSSAAMEARAFNLYAYANRTQASHYVSAMVLQSYLSFAFFGEAWLTDADGLMRTLATCSARTRSPFWQTACPILSGLPGVGAVLGFLRGALALMDALVSAYQVALRESDLDAVVGREVIPDLLDASAALAGASTRMMQEALVAVAGSSREVIAANDPGAEVDELGRTAANLSTCLFDRAHLREANGSPLAPRAPAFLDPTARSESDRVARAKRAMGQVANASRPGDFVTARRAGAFPLPGWLGPMKALLESQPKWGQTRLLSHGLARGWDDPEGGNFIREPEDAPDAPASMLAQGDDLGADDAYQLSIGPPRLGPFRNPLSCGPEDDPFGCWGEPRIGRRPDRPFRFAMKPSVWALDDREEHGGGGGIHWRVAHADGSPAGAGWRAPEGGDAFARLLGLNEVLRAAAPGVNVPVYVANVRPIEDGNHPWKGLASFPHFQPGLFPEACSPAGGRGPDARLDRAAGPGEDFNQPSTWVALSRPVRGGRMRAVARAQAYYHRPGDWAEPPSFFNPYWRARLAPVAERPERDAAIETLWMTLPAAIREKGLVH
ncbi:MAG TPA: hypothetical protein VND93_17840 [Myxococcales bacterium]|nr:hypothetical protein [Myxococcales bacterium]